MTGVGAVTAVLRRVVDGCARAFGRLQVALVDRRTGAAPLVVLDIDNTLADAWPSFTRPYSSHRARLAGLEALPGMKAVAHDAPVAAGAAVMFLSHRNPWEWPVTYRWLRSHGFDARWWNVVVVPSAAAKVPIVRRLVRGRDVPVWDDLSFGHETGTVSTYDDVRAALRDLGVELHTWDEIVAVTGRERGADEPPPGR